MIKAVFLCAIVAGGIGALAGNRAAIALLAGTAFTCSLIGVGVPFMVPLWMLVDACIMAVIVHRHMTVREVVVVALFFPLWGTYFVDGDASWKASLLISSAQFLLTFPIFRAADSGRRLLQRLKRDRGGMPFIAWGLAKGPANAWAR